MPQPHPQKAGRSVFVRCSSGKAPFARAKLGVMASAIGIGCRSIGYREMGLLCMFYVASIDFFSVLVRPPAKEQKNDGI